MICLDLRSQREADCHRLHFLQKAKPVSPAVEVCPLHPATSHQGDPRLCLALQTLYNKLAMPMNEENFLPACVVWQTALSYSATSQSLCSAEISHENWNLKNIKTSWHIPTLYFWWLLRPQKSLERWLQ